MANNPILFLEQSPIFKEMLTIKNITDISFNGKAMYFVSNVSGRQKANHSPSNQEVGDFLKQMANLSEKQFSFVSPILDVSFGRYRLNAVNSSLARKQNEKVYTFSLRIASEFCQISSSSSFFEGEGERLLLSLLAEGESVVIGGKTSSGKTELEKYLLSKMPSNCRVIVIDNIEELDLVENDDIDLTTWLCNERIADATFSSLIRNALRNNPDYILIAEARGKEMLEALLSAMSGHPIITSIHAQDLESMPERMARLAMLSSEKLEKTELLGDIYHHIRYYVFLEKRQNIDGSLSRFLSKIGVSDDRTLKIKPIYERTRP
jgi:pilus assembly protein CpaF